MLWLGRFATSALVAKGLTATNDDDESGRGLDTTGASYESTECLIPYRACPRATMQKVLEEIWGPLDEVVETRSWVVHPKPSSTLERLVLSTGHYLMAS